MCFGFPDFVFILKLEPKHKLNKSVLCYKMGWALKLNKFMLISKFKLNNLKRLKFKLERTQHTKHELLFKLISLSIGWH